MSLGWSASSNAATTTASTSWTTFVIHYALSDGQSANPERTIRAAADFRSRVLAMSCLDENMLPRNFVPLVDDYDGTEIHIEEEDETEWYSCSQWIALGLLDE